jgi:hypothetical protein
MFIPLEEFVAAKSCQADHEGGLRKIRRMVEIFSGGHQSVESGRKSIKTGQLTQIEDVVE